MLQINGSEINVISENIKPSIALYYEHSHGEYSPRRVSSQLGDSNTTRDDYQRETENGRKLFAI